MDTGRAPKIVRMLQVQSDVILLPKIINRQEPKRERYQQNQMYRVNQAEKEVDLKVVKRR